MDTHFRKRSLVFQYALFGVSVVDVLRFCLLFEHIPAVAAAQQRQKIILCWVVKIFYGFHLASKEIFFPYNNMSPLKYSISITIYISRAVFTASEKITVSRPYRI